MPITFKKSSAHIRVSLPLLAALSLLGCSSSQERAQSYYEHGTKLLAEHDNARAALEFKNAIRLNKQLLSAWQGLAEVDEATQNWGELTAVLRTVVDLDPQNVAAKKKLAKLLLRAGSLDEALNLVNQTNEMEGKDADVSALRSIILFKLKDSEGAKREAEAALAIDPKQPGAMVVLSADRLARGDARGALEILNSKAAADSNDLGIQLFKLKILEQTQDLQQAEALLRRLVELYPDEPEFRKQLVKLYVFQHRPEDAEREERAIVAAHPDDSQAELELVQLLGVLKGLAAARQELVDRIKAGKDIFPYQMALAELDFSQGHFTDSFQLLESIINDQSSPDHVLTAQVKLAAMQLSRKQTDAAEKLVSDILRKDNRNTDGLSMRASIRMDRGELEPAINDLRQALNDQPRSVPLMLLLAVAYERSGSIELAEKQFSDATKTSNFDANTGLAYVAFLQRRGSAARAEEVLSQLAARWPQSEQILTMLAQAKLGRRDWTGAQELAEAIRRIGNNRDNGIADQILGAALNGRDKYEESIAVLQNAYAAAPAAGPPMLALVQVYMRAKQPQKAVAFLQNVLKANPTNGQAHALLGVVELAQNAPNEALKSFKEAIRVQPQDPVGYRALANFYLAQKNVDEAVQVLRGGLQQQPDSTILHLALAGAYEQKDDFEAAISEYQSILAKEPGSLVVLNNLASLLADHRTDKESFERAKSLAASLRKSPIPQFKDTLGWVDYRQGDYKNAIPLLEEAAGGLPSGALVRYHLGMSYLAIGEPTKAAEQFKQALNQGPDAELKEKIEVALKKMAS
jgi:tetratricopeptide (TPR) repeat protein